MRSGRRGGAGPASGRRGGGSRWRGSLAAVPAVAQWFYTPVVLRFGALQALLSFTVFVGFTLVLVLVPWPRG